MTEAGRRARALLGALVGAVAFGLVQAPALAQAPAAGATQIRTAQQAMGNDPATSADMSALPAQRATAAAQAQISPTGARNPVDATQSARLQGGTSPVAANAATARIERAGGLQPFGARLFTQGDMPVEPAAVRRPARAGAW